MKKTYLAAGTGRRVVQTCFRCLLIIPMLLSGLFSARAAAQTPQAAPRVSIDVHNAAIITVFQSIQQQTGYSFVYNTSDVDTQRKVTLAVDNQPLGTALDRLFAGLDISYTLREKHVVLSRKAQNTPPTAFAAASAEPSGMTRARPWSGLRC